MPAGKTENIKQVRLSQLFPFERHPFKMNNDAEMLKIVESVKQYGVLSPAIARPLPDCGYELVSSHRRKRTTTRLRSSSWTAICSAKGCFRARERLRTGSSLRQCSIKGKGKI